MGRRAFSLLEVLVVIAIATILLGLLLVGVQAVREASRCNQCASHLRQLGIGISQYESAFKMYPPGFSRFSMHVTVLPFLEQQALYDEVDTYYRNGGEDSDFNMTCPIYFCPSDGAARIRDSGLDKVVGTNYAASSGTWFMRAGGFDGAFRYLWSDPGIEGGAVRPSDISDGTSNTIGMSELLRADGTLHRMRVVWNTPRPFRNATELDAFADFCDRVPLNPTAPAWVGNVRCRGVPWSNGSMAITLYNHVSTPNRPSCFNGSRVASACATAASGHRNGVNALFLDGHVVFVSNTIDRSPWRRWASRSDE